MNELKDSTAATATEKIHKVRIPMETTPLLEAFPLES